MRGTPSLYRMDSLTMTRARATQLGHFCVVCNQPATGHKVKGGNWLCKRHTDDYDKGLIQPTGGFEKALRPGTIEEIEQTREDAATTPEKP